MVQRRGIGLWLDKAIYRLAPCAFLCLVLCSCVKEDRTVCPFWLNVDLSQSEKGIVRKDIAEAMVYDVNGCQSGDIVFTDVERGNRWFSVQRGDFGVRTVYGREDGIYGQDGRVLNFAPGHQADSIYVACNDSTFTGETLTVYTVFHKQFCGVTFIGAYEDEKGYTTAGTFTLDKSVRNFFDVYDIEVRGSFGGLDLMKLEGVSGDFRYRPAEQKDSTCVALARQPGTELYVDIIEKGTGILSHTMSLTASLRAIGYDWTETDLKDVRLTLTMVAECLYEIRIKEWSPVDMGDISI